MQPEMLTKEQKKEYNRFPSNVMLGLLVTTCCTPGFFSLGASFPAGKLSDKDRQLVIMRVASLSRCAYERMQHYPMAIKAGWDDGEIKLIESGNLGVEREDTILRFVDECVKQVKVTDETFKASQKYYDDTQLAELTLMIGYYMMTARFLETLEVPLDVYAASWDNLRV